MISLNVDAMRNGDRANIIDSLLHETQHGIQEIENFSRGANAAWTPDEYLSRHLDYTGDAGPKADLMYKHNEDAYRLDADNAEYLGEGARPAHQQALSNFYYMMNAGEAEARAVELRRRLSARERAERMPWVDYRQWYDRAAPDQSSATSSQSSLAPAPAPTRVGYRQWHVRVPRSISSACWARTSDPLINSRRSPSRKAIHTLTFAH